MLTILLTIGLLNLGLGFALAGWIDPSGELPLGMLFRARIFKIRKEASKPDSATGAPAPKEGATAARNSNPAAAPEPEEIDESWRSFFPPEWASLLESNLIRPNSFTEALLWVIRLEHPTHRQTLVSVDKPDRASRSEPFPIEAFTKECHTWMSQLTRWATVLGEYQERPKWTDLNQKLRECLAYQVAQTLKICQWQDDSPTALDASRDMAALDQRVHDVLQYTNELRDRVEELLSCVPALDERLKECRIELRTDIGSGTLSRMGFESFVRDWIAHDGDRVRIVSGALVDIDDCTTCNDREGVHVVDDVIAALGGALLDLVRKDRGCDRICRIGGQSYFIFFGDTGMRNATLCVERVRKSIEATQFQVGHKVISFTVSSALCEWNKTETWSQWLDRLRALLQEAKRAGGNRTCVGDDEGSRIIVAVRNAKSTREVALA